MSHTRFIFTDVMKQLHYLNKHNFITSFFIIIVTFSIENKRKLKNKEAKCQTKNR